jgi:purine-binding chemotaxis protein CheW
MDRGRAEILVFEVDGRRYGLPAAEVRELARAVTIVPLPTPRALVEGVVDVRGEAVPVLDLRARLGLPAKGVEPSDHLVIARATGRTVALRVDRALELRGGEVAAVEAAGGPGGEGDGAVGMARLADGLVPIVDLPRFLARAEADGEGRP